MISCFFFLPVKPDRVAEDITIMRFDPARLSSDGFSFVFGGNGAGLTGDLIGLLTLEFLVYGAGEVGPDEV